MKTMLIEGVEYVEAKADEAIAKQRNGEVCSQCAFGLGRLRACAAAIERSPEVFGGECAQRGVIYAPAPKESA